jgi:hypothetical protein
MKTCGQSWLLLVAFAGAAALPVYAIQSDVEPTRDPPTATIQLFNGKNPDGWDAFVSNGADPKQTWSVEGGMIRCTGAPEGYLRTRTAYADCKLHVEWRWPNGDGKGNSGAILPMALFRMAECFPA